jgi:long-subunit acyl-CoA synthetase (AMP-forming)
VAQAVVVGEGQKHLAALLTLDAGGAAKVAAACGAPGTTVAGWAVSPAFVVQIQKGVDAVNAQVAQFESIKKFTLLPAEFTIDGGELTPTMKIKRKAVAEKYAKELAALFG